MKFVVQETVFTYPRSLLDAWKNGDKNWIPNELFVPQEVHNQPNYHFGEYYALSKYLELGWSGTAYYPLGEWEVTNPKYNEGRELVAKFIDSTRLDIFRAIRSNKAGGEPDLLLYKEDGSLLFVEVKKQSDSLSQAQIICLAQIKSILNCEVAVAYLAEENQSYVAKTHELQLVELPSSWLERN
ncbi:VRR-NUC domain-containing protein [Vibrio crassostreae]|uniref:VRR-NUC domain-containing protein n=1 Tax=Vibrio crassostreae TaxID=246167 RepID=A0ABM9QZN0_9VIBR|nr:VRR-NUC domain-containing protein [Vibrio crassostreae]TCL28286.1 VRR-NUC domain-containing protein [Vibrio crassostreae]TCT50538.1 VRR-NUC domain-containing protein [Vibrio crassostreae]TCT59614.1 VRR-NUC domain-containing protein [Vibrio crassostreae]CAK2011026.1 VRR-NUC domain-containing protein [Vibrio crassostreae]CAK2057508.1 VRR-NUC domain-containing protein [Vibrio crassostreae]